MIDLESILVLSCPTATKRNFDLIQDSAPITYYREFSLFLFSLILIYNTRNSELRQNQQSVAGIWR